MNNKPIVNVKWFDDKIPDFFSLVNSLYMVSPRENDGSFMAISCRQIVWVSVMDDNNYRVYMFGTHVYSLSMDCTLDQFNGMKEGIQRKLSSHGLYIVREEGKGNLLCLGKPEVTDFDNHWDFCPVFKPIEFDPRYLDDPRSEIDKYREPVKVGLRTIIDSWCPINIT